MKTDYIYAVIEVMTNNRVRIKRTKNHSRMMKAVKAAIKRKNHYTVLRQAIKCTTV